MNRHEENLGDECCTGVARPYAPNLNSQIASAPDHTDPWAHRSAKMKCATCMWFAPKGPGPLGRCRRHAPTMSGYPAVFVTDWCGDHKLDENSI